MPYDAQDKKDYLKYYRTAMAKHKVGDGPVPLTFARFTGGKKKLYKKSTAKKSKSIDTARTQAVTTGLKRAGVTTKEIKRLRK